MATRVNRDWGGSPQEISFSGYSAGGHQGVGGWGHTLRVHTPSATFEVAYENGQTYIRGIGEAELRTQPVGETAVVVETDD